MTTHTQQSHTSSLETVPHAVLTKDLQQRSYYRTRTRPFALIYTLIVDGKRMSIGTADAFKHFRDYQGITIELSTCEDIETLAIHPGTPPSVRQNIGEFIDFRKKRAAELRRAGQQ